MPDETYTATVASTGTATVTIKPPRREVWIVSQVSNEMPTAPGGASCALRKNGYLITPLVAQADAASGDPATTVLPSDQLTIEWSGATPGDQGRVIVFYELAPS